MLNFGIAFRTLEVVNSDGFGMFYRIGFLFIVVPERIHFNRRSDICSIFSHLIGVTGHGVGPAPVIFLYHVHPVGIEDKHVLNG